MRRLAFLTVPDCPLSYHGRRVLAALAADGLLTWHEVPADSPDAHALSGGPLDRLPAIIDEAGELLAYGRLSERRLRRTLAGDATNTVEARTPLG